MSYTFRPQKRENTPLIIGLAGPTKSGKSKSALRIADGLAAGGTVAMINTEGARGHLYADDHKYVAVDLEAPYRPQSFIDALKSMAALKPAVGIIDSITAMHDGAGGVLEWHEEILDKIAGEDHGKRQRATFAAWIEPKRAENLFIYEMLSMDMPIILCIRAKEKAFIKKGADPVFKWSPILGDAISFETLFTLMFLPGARGMPTLEFSDLRTPFDTFIKFNQPVDEQLGRSLAAWAKGSAVPSKDEMISGEFVDRFDKVKTADDGREISAQWEKTKETVARKYWPRVEEAKRRARDRLKGAA